MLSILYNFIPTPSAPRKEESASLRSKLHSNCKWSSYVVDTLGGIATLVVGIFASMGMIASLTPAASWALIGAGGTYAAISAMLWMQEYVRSRCVSWLLVVPQWE